jgi:hypothetical protein
MGYDRRSWLPSPISALRSESGRPRSHKHPSGGPLGLTVLEVRREHPQSRNQDSLCLLLSHRPSAPALPHRPFAHSPLTMSASRTYCGRPLDRFSRRLIAEAVEELWCGASFGVLLSTGRTVSFRLSRSAEAAGGLSRELHWVPWHWSGCQGLWRWPRGVRCQAFEILDGGGEQELVPGAAEAAQSEAHQRVDMLGLAKQGFDPLPCGA